MIVTAKRKLNAKIYGKLLRETLPQVITSEEENERMLEIISKLITKERTPEENALYLLVCQLVEDFEAEAYPIPDDLPPRSMLQFLMEQRELKQKDIVHLFGSQGITSEVLNGKRDISKAQAKKLAQFFGVSVEHFI